MATIDVKDALGATVALEKPLVPGRAAAAASRPVAFSNEDFAVIDGLETAIASTNTKLDTINTSLGTIDGRVDGLETLITSTNTKLDTAITALQIIDNMVLAAGTANIGDVDVLTVPADPFGANADAASVSTSISAKLKAIATALGTTALDLGASTGGSRTLRIAMDTAQLAALATTAQAMSAGFQLVSIPTDAKVPIQGTVATNVAITANPMNLGAQGVSSENAAITTARQVQLVADLVGKLIVLPYANPENFVSGAITSAMTGTTTTSLLAAPASGLRNYITQITVSNAHATVGTDVVIQDGSGGTTLYTIPAAAVYGGAVITFPTPLRQPTTATAIFCANVTTGASTKVSASGYKGA